MAEPQFGAAPQFGVLPENIHVSPTQKSRTEERTNPILSIGTASLWLRTGSVLPPPRPNCAPLPVVVVLLLVSVTASDDGARGT